MTGTLVVISYAAGPAQAKVLHWRSQTIRRGISLGFSLALAVGLSIWLRDELGTVGIASFALMAGIGLFWVLLGLLGWWRARRELGRVGQGAALVMGRDGVWTAGEQVPWQSVAAIAAKAGRLGASDDLAIDLRDGRRLTLPMDYLDHLPATIDGAVRTMSGGRCRVDFSSLDD